MSTASTTTTGNESPLDDDASHRADHLLDRRRQLTDALTNLPYDLILYLERAVVHSELAYPDLAAGDAYRALLLTDEVLNEGFEYHDQAVESLQSRPLDPLPLVLDHGHLLKIGSDYVEDEPKNQAGLVVQVAKLSSVRAFQILSLSLLLCGCLKSAYEFCERGLALAPDNDELLQTMGYIKDMARRRLRRKDFNPNVLPEWGLVRREVYPWNSYEPDRFAPESLDFLNSELAKFAPKCVVQASELPVLLEAASDTDDYDIIPTCKQLGLFVKDDVAPGETVLDEYSLLTANNRLKEPVCDACSSDLPPLGTEPAAVNCDECYDTVFCSQKCHDLAQETYHPAVCDKDVDAIAKDPDASEADETLHLLLLARVLAMSNHQEIHPLDVMQIKYIWGDFVPSASNDIEISPSANPPPEWTLPFSFKYNVETPLHILEKMDVDIYTTLDEHDLWVLNTLYSKFRGTASARKNPRDGRPDVAAVHPFWCLANHDCNPNVTWEWGGRMLLWARKEKIVGNVPGGLKAGDEVLNHYCDISLPVEQRREWAKGSLGGWCMCQRCRDEAAAASDHAADDGTAAEEHVA
ncbi:Putative Zinc finger, MYND-type, tetratricopeptide-like helical domain superfamily [Colletotrichum destructivum]|uniref:Zinc finger, MYND-type, tetratricopeptide-like helical domain superfamily n=1 Tax=Colletotrichum destructivum TaxID=34406 RepID=A0AAX4HZ33_9PEZI|nr:Putative Zinc finger, MYND-type, tetratricopeptide-like helical domain superfamily [Colletotrichum destructivum]